MCYLISLFKIFKEMLILNLMPATCFKQVEKGATKDREFC